MKLKTLQQAISGRAAAFRSRVTLQPGGGVGDKVFPPTYEGGQYAIESRRVTSDQPPVDCVLLDSVQSQANRMEEALQSEIEAGRINLPIVEVDFSGADLVSEIDKITSLQAPHRIVDAILRDSLLEGVPFRKSDIGRTISEATLANATPLFQYCPTALLFGIWDSTGPKGGLGSKFQRAIVSEIIGIDAVFGVKTASRIDPLEIRKGAGPLYHAKGGNELGWTLDESEAATAKKKPAKIGKDGSPAEANHGNIPPSISKSNSEGVPLGGGVTIDRAEQTVTLSLPALRRLRFPVDCERSAEFDQAAQTVLAAMGLCAAALAVESGFDLRSRCLLWPTDALKWELLDKPGQPPETIALDGDTAVQLLNDAIEHACKLGLPWQKEPLTLQPSPQLAGLVKKSQELAVAEGSAAEGDA